MRHTLPIVALGLLLGACSPSRPEVETGPDTPDAAVVRTGEQDVPAAKNPDANPNASVAASLGIPPGHLPEPGQCKVWMPSEPPGQQKKKYKSGDCDSLRSQVPPGGWLVYRPGDDKKEIVVSEYGESSVIRWKGIYDYVTGALLREEVRGQ